LGKPFATISTYLNSASNAAYFITLIEIFAKWFGVMFALFEKL
jgi:hypothetical protein